MGHMARSHVRNLKQRVTLMADTRMYIDEQAACDAKTCMTEEGGGAHGRLIQSVRSNNREQPLMAHKRNER